MDIEDIKQELAKSDPIPSRNPHLDRDMNNEGMRIYIEGNSDMRITTLYI